jgi:phosphoribosyl-AMP cyclohydrolase
MSEKNIPWMDEVRFNDTGLIPVIAQDCNSKRILMLAWMNKQALLQTAETGLATYWSRSKERLWKKGESSGHFQFVKTLQLDCDGDTIILLVEQKGDIACHTGTNSCFFRVLINRGWEVSEPVVRDPKDIYSDG